MSGIESNCKAFQKSVSSFNGMITDEYINELNVIKTETGDTNNDEDFIIDNNIDLQFERAVNALTRGVFLRALIYDVTPLKLL
ncbi:4595_t:CDS:2 [Funneliformis geosporum]|nr:4595_t:CDS:2 [Funneliformis geosporum]